MRKDEYPHVNIYCDESRHTSNPEDRFMVIGGLSCPREQRVELSRKINMIKKRFSTWGEFGWKTLSPNRRVFYWELLRLFAEEPDLCYRCIVVDCNILDHEKYSYGDGELGFYKLYYQMLIHWLKPSVAYHIYLDWQQNRVQTRFANLKDALKRKLLGRTKIECLEPVLSHEMPLVQLCDLLTGAVGYAFNERTGSETKLQFCSDLAHSVGFPRLNISTPLGEAKFNIFLFTGRSS